MKYREENGRFTNRRQLQKVPRLGAKTYEQCVGFMRISEGENPLDRTPIHPESYKVVDQLFKELRVELDKLGSKELSVLLSEQQPEQLAVKLDVGVHCATFSTAYSARDVTLGKKCRCLFSVRMSLKLRIWLKAWNSKVPFAT